MQIFKHPVIRDDTENLEFVYVSKRHEYSVKKYTKNIRELYKKLIKLNIQNENAMENFMESCMKKNIDYDILVKLTKFISDNSLSKSN